jgi:tetratricopeptide (TPR) repeat protein
MTSPARSSLMSSTAALSLALLGACSNESGGDRPIVTEHETAYPDFQAAIASFDRAGVAEQSGRFDAAVGAYREGEATLERLLEEHPDSPLMRDSLARNQGRLGLLYRNLGEFERADRLFSTVIENCENFEPPDTPHPYPLEQMNRTRHGGTLCNMGDMLMNQGELDRADECLRRAEEILTGTSDVTGREFLAIAQGALGDLQSRLDNPEFARIREAWRGTTRSQVRREKVGPELHAAEGADLAIPELESEELNRREREGPAALLDQLENSIEPDAEPSAETLYWIARCRARLGRGDALQTVERAIARKPGWFAAELLRADLLRLVGERERALELAEALACTYPDRASTSYLAGLIRAGFMRSTAGQLGAADPERRRIDLGTALDHFDRALDADPEHSGARLFRALTLASSTYDGLQSLSLRLQVAQMTSDDEDVLIHYVTPHWSMHGTRFSRAIEALDEAIGRGFETERVRETKAQLEEQWRELQ